MSFDFQVRPRPRIPWGCSLRSRASMLNGHTPGGGGLISVPMIGALTATLLSIAAIWAIVISTHFLLLDTALKRGEAEARQDAETGKIVLRRQCFFPAATIVFKRRFGVDCPLAKFSLCGFGLNYVDPVQVAGELGYDEQMHRIALAKWGAAAFRNALAEAHALQSNLNAVAANPPPRQPSPAAPPSSRQRRRFL